MWTPGRLNDGSRTDYGFGWELSARRGHKIVGHSGLTGTYILRIPDVELTVVVLTNLGRWASQPSRGAQARKIALETAVLVEPSLRLAPMTDPAPELTRKLQALFVGLASGKIDSTLVSPAMVREFAAERDGIMGFFARLGPLRSMELVDRYEPGDGLALRYRLVCEKDSVVFFVQVNHLGTVVRLDPE